MILWFIRTVFCLLVLALMVLGFEKVGTYTVTVIGCLMAIVLGLSIDIMVPRKRLYDLAGIFFGLVVGLIIGMVLSYLVEFLYVTYNIDKSSDPFLFDVKNGIKALINLLCCYLSVSFIMQTKDDFRFIIPYVQFSKQTKGSNPAFLDTSVIIDGRIADIASTKIIDSPLIVPRFILNELQLVADSADRSRRNRGRRGLDILHKMQSDKSLDLEIQDIDLTTRERSEPVDHQLVLVAKKMAGKIITNDYNLNKVAKLRGVTVININDLAGALKPVVLPGEMLHVNIVKVGDQAGQGVGYLDDGTMVVVEQGRDYVGKDIDVVITSALQTSAGRMIFGKTDDNHIN